MRTVVKWVVGGALLVPVFIACGNKPSGYDDPNALSSSGDDSGGGSSGGGFTTSGSGGSFVTGAGGAPTMVADSRCKAGHYTGNFLGTYTSHLTGIGFPIPVTGDVQLDLYQ